MKLTDYKCPVDQVQLGITTRHPGIEVEHCWVCGGIFYDRGELEQKLGRSLALQEWEESASSKECSKCNGKMEGRTRKNMEIFHCTRCQGIWVPRIQKKKKFKKLVIPRTNLPKEIRVNNPLRPSTWKQRKKGAYYDEDIEIHHYVMTLLGFPYEYNEKASRFPVVTIALILLNTLFFLLTPHTATFFQKFGFTPGTFSISSSFTLITCMFLHVDIWHLLGNMYFLWVLGDNIEDRMGSFVYFIFYMGCGILASFFYFPTVSGKMALIPTVGASGAISGLIGAYLYLFPRAKFLWIMMFYPFKIAVWVLIPVWAILQFILMKGGPAGVNYAAHFGGFIVGLFITFLITQRFILELAGIDKTDPVL